MWLGERAGSSQMPPETEGLVGGQRLVVEDLRKPVWLRERGELEKEVKSKTPRWGVHYAEQVKLMEGLMPEEGPWPRERRTPPERMYPGVWVEPAKEVWPAERGGSAERAEPEREGLVDGAWSKAC